MRATVLPRLLVLLLASLLSACGSNAPAPIEDRSAPGSLRSDQRYTVLRGDTLYAIAFRFGLDFRGLAAANAIQTPFTIYPGQVLRLAEVEPPRRAQTAARSVERDAPAPIVVAAQPPPAPQKPKNVVAPNSSTAKVAVPVSPAVAKASPKTVPPKTTSKPAKALSGELKVGAWRWPVKGKVIRSFDSNLHKGIDISGARGDPVLATAKGEVVYAGSGIAGYGLMLIVRHNQEYLSAYGHNDVLLVAEGDAVSAGQVVARRGSTGTDSVKLHFEIRKLGRPVDPKRLLPAL